MAYAKAHPHPDERDKTIWEMFEAERPLLVPYAGPGVPALCLLFAFK